MFDGATVSMPVLQSSVAFVGFGDGPLCGAEPEVGGEQIRTTGVRVMAGDGGGQRLEEPGGQAGVRAGSRVNVALLREAEQRRRGERFGCAMVHLSADAGEERFKRRGQVRARPRLAAGLGFSAVRALGVGADRSQGNFVLARFAGPKQANAAWEGLAERGVLTRRWLSRPGLEAALRITCPGNEIDFQRLTAALGEVLA